MIRHLLHLKDVEEVSLFSPEVLNSATFYHNGYQRQLFIIILKLLDKNLSEIH